MRGVPGSGESGTILVDGVSQPGKVAVHSPGSSEAGQASWIGRGWLVRRSRQAALIVAPSGITPSVTNRHRATRSFLASATIETRRTRPRSALTRSRNQRLSAVSGWWRSQSQAIELAWLWLRQQPDTALSRWFRERVRSDRDRVRRVSIVALARKLLVALWRFVADGVLPEGAKLKAA